MKLYYTTLNSPVGKLYTAKTAKGFSFLSLNRRQWERCLKDLKKHTNVELHRNDVTFLPLKKALKRYFSGEEINFSFPFDLLWGTPFQRRVWNVMRGIRHGQTRSYRWLAQKIGNSNKARAVGQACGSNPLPILIPCHRVIREDGGLGGFGAGLHIKRKLLELESKR